MRFIAQVYELVADHVVFPRETLFADTTEEVLLEFLLLGIVVVGLILSQAGRLWSRFGCRKTLV